MSINRYYGADRRSVVSETIEDETVIVDLRRGAYFSIAGIGAAIWNALEGGVSVDSLIAQIAEAFPDLAGQMPNIVNDFVAELVSQNLMAPTGPSAELAAPAIKFGNSFAVPELRCYEDMEDLLLLDPIHDVEEAGWPVRKPTDMA